MKGDAIKIFPVEMNAEEGDSDSFLLQPTNDASPDLDFRISPLKSLRPERSCATSNDDHHRQFSHSDAFKEKQRQKPYCSSPKNAEGKENIDIVLEDNSGMHISLEKPVQARKGKRAGRCNLRKSLAWNMAFFTEEGILDPQELSILRGSSQNFLSIKEEPEYSAVSSSSFEEISDLQALEEKLCKKPAPSFQVKEQKLGSLPYTQQSSTQEEPLMSRASKRSQLSKGTIKSVPQGGGCPQPSASCTKKRHTHTNTTNAMSKIPKLASSKAYSALHLLPSKNTAAAINGLTWDKNGPPVNSEKNVQSSSTNTNKDAACATSLAESSELGRGKYVANQLSEQPSVANLLAEHENRDIIDLKMTPDSTLLAANKHTSTNHANPSNVEVPLPQQDNRHYGNHRSAKYSTKPSGLRMPSPSLGYFCQAKATASHSALKPRLTKLCDLSVFCNRALGKLDVGNDVSRLSSPYATTSTLPKLLCTTVAQTIGVTTPSQQTGSNLNSGVPFIATLDSQITQKPNLKTKELWIMGVNNSCISGTYQKTNSQQLPHDNYSRTDIEEQNLKQSLRSPGHDHGEIKQALHEETGKLQTIDGTFVVKSQHSKRQQAYTNFENVSDVMQNSRDSGRLESKYSPSQRSSKQVISDVNCQQEEVAVSENCLDEYQTCSNGCLLKENTYCPNLQFDGTNICHIDQVSCLEAELSLMPNDEKKTDPRISRSSESVFGSSREIHGKHRPQSPTSEKIPLGDYSGLMNNHSPIEKQHACFGNHNQSDAGGIPSKNHKLPGKDDVDATTVRKVIFEVSTKELVPFSDEWLADRVAAGEDILTMKTGAVQNSPPDKSLPEPGPWSPVKRSNQDLGPFDCTKYTNLQLLNSGKPLE